MQTYSFTLASLMNIEELPLSLESLSKLGFNFVDMYGEPDLFKNKCISESYFSSYGLTVDGITGMWGKISPGSWKRRLLSNDIAFLKQSEQYVKDCINFGALLGANKFNICLFSDPNYFFDQTHNHVSIIEKRKALSKAIPIINRLTDYAKEFDIKILIEPLNRYSTPFCSNFNDAMFMIDNCRNLNLLLDTFHMNIEEDSFENTITSSKKNLGQIHFADNNRKMPGFGHINFSNIMKTLKQICFNDAICFEPTISCGSAYQNDILMGFKHIKNIVDRLITS